MSANKIILRLMGEGEKFQDFEVEEKVATQSEFIRNYVEDMASEGQPVVVKLYNIKSSMILSKVLQYCEYHSNVEANNITKEDANKWDAEFAKELFEADERQEALVDVLMASDYLNIESLQHLLCRKVAEWVERKSVEEMRVLFNVRKDFSPEEEAEVRRRTEWAKESTDGNTSSRP